MLRELLCVALKLDGLLIIGGVTTNSDAAQLAEIFAQTKYPTKGNLYWSMMHTSSHKYGYFGSGSNLCYSFSNAYEINDYAPRLYGARMWENSAPLNSIDLPQINVHGVGTADTSSQSSDPSTSYILDGADVISKYKGLCNAGSQIAASFT